MPFDKMNFCCDNSCCILNCLGDSTCTLSFQLALCRFNLNFNGALTFTVVSHMNLYGKNLHLKIKNLGETGSYPVHSGVGKTANGQFDVYLFRYNSRSDVITCVLTSPLAFAVSTRLLTYSWFVNVIVWLLIGICLSFCFVSWRYNDAYFYYYISVGVGRKRLASNKRLDYFLNQTMKITLIVQGFLFRHCKLVFSTHFYRKA